MAVNAGRFHHRWIGYFNEQLYNRKINPNSAMDGTQYQKVAIYISKTQCGKGLGDSHNHNIYWTQEGQKKTGSKIPKTSDDQTYIREIVREKKLCLELPRIGICGET